MTFFRHLFFLLAAYLALGADAAVAEARFEDLAQLEKRVIAQLGAGIGQPGGPARPIDRRLKLAACPSAPTISAPMPAAAMARCEPLGWRIHVPLVRNRAADAPRPMRVAEQREPVIRKGDQVELVADGGNFTVSTPAVAQEDGALGERIRVRTERRTASVIARVDSQGRVLLTQFD